MRLFGLRLLQLIPVLLIVTLATFLLTEFLPGDPVYDILGPEARPEQIALVRQQLDLDAPLPSRYVSWVSDALQGDLGKSLITGRSVSATLRQRMPVNLEIAVLTQLLALLVAIPLGAWSAYRAGRRFDRVGYLVLDEFKGIDKLAGFHKGIWHPPTYLYCSRIQIECGPAGLRGPLRITALKQEATKMGMTRCLIRLTFDGFASRRDCFLHPSLPDQSGRQGSPARSRPRRQGQSAFEQCLCRVEWSFLASMIHPLGERLKILVRIWPGRDCCLY